MILCYENNPKSENLTFSSLPCLVTLLEATAPEGKNCMIETTKRERGDNVRSTKPSPSKCEPGAGGGGAVLWTDEPETAGASRGFEGQQQSGVSAFDIQLVQNLVERCLQLYMNQREAVSILQQQAKIEPSFTELVWQKLEEQNPEFYRAYYARLRLKDQILVFNELIECHYHALRAEPESIVMSLTGDQLMYARNQSLERGAVLIRKNDVIAAFAAHRGDGDEAMLRGERIIHKKDADGGWEPSLCNRGEIPESLRFASHGDGILPKSEHTLSEFDAPTAVLENDGLMGGLNTFPRNFSLSDLALDLRGAEDDRSINLLDTWNHDDVGGDFGGFDGVGTEVGLGVDSGLEVHRGLKRNFSLDSGGLLDL